MRGLSWLASVFEQNGNSMLRLLVALVTTLSFFGGVVFAAESATQGSAAGSQKH
jgi:hypothetical protein